MIYDGTSPCVLLRSRQRSSRDCGHVSPVDTPLRNGETRARRRFWLPISLSFGRSGNERNHGRNRAGLILGFRGLAFGGGQLEIDEMSVIPHPSGCVLSSDWSSAFRRGCCCECAAPLCRVVYRSGGHHQCGAAVVSAGGLGGPPRQHHLQQWRRRWRVCMVEASGNGTGSSGRSSNPAGEQRISAVGTRTSGAARERRLQKAAEEKRRKAEEANPKYPEWASILEDACKDDIELREIIGDSVGNPEEMRKRVEQRVRRKGRDVLTPKTGSAVPMTVSFKSDFDATGTFVWLELYGEPSDGDVETIGNVLTSWYLLGKLGAFNSMNMQLTESPLNSKLSYSTDRASEALPSMFHNITDLEFQDNWGRVWVDLGTSDPVALDVLVNGLTGVSSDHVGIKHLVFGGQKLGDWEEGMIDPEDGYKKYKI